MAKSFYLSSFQAVEPKYKAAQPAILEYLKKTHQSVEKLVERYAVKDHQIQSRSFECPDMHEAEKLSESDMLKRTLFFDQRADEIFNDFYQYTDSQPEHLIHVTCTGYLAPSAAQKLVAARQWGTEVTHAYHMGCYAALPAIRLAQGQCLQNKAVDIVHTEMCSLYFDPSQRTPEQLVVKTLFADGHIRYQMKTEKNQPGFRLLKIKEKILPDSVQDMSWMPGPRGMLMTLSREVPHKIKNNIRDFTKNLIEESGLSFSETLKTGLFAIHPGGPKIIETVAQTLELRPEQFRHSLQILKQRGNMSSATLPHIWQSMLTDPDTTNSSVVSLAFGPGLTVFGGIFELEK